MRIISGSARGRVIKVPGDVARPTTDRVREALFSMLHQVIPEARILDLFAGSGANGFEALSRGADSCVFVDSSKQAQNVIKGNAKSLKLSSMLLSAQDAFSYLESERSSFDLIFADPPYKKSVSDRDFAQELLDETSLAERLVDEGLFVVETAKGASLIPSIAFSLLDQRSYGSCSIWFFRKKKKAEG